jgi:hypothetical protein
VNGGAIFAQLVTNPASGNVESITTRHLIVSSVTKTLSSGTETDVWTIGDQLDSAGEFQETWIQATTDPAYPRYYIRVFIAATATADGVLGYVAKYL